MNLRDFNEHETIRTEAAPTCVFCGDEGFLLYEELVNRLYGVPGKWRFFKCPNCGFIWLNPRPVLDDLMKCYPDTYYTHNLPSEPPHFRLTGFKGILRSLILKSCWGYYHLGPQVWWAPLLGRFLGTFPFLRKRASQGLEALMPPYRTGGRLLDVGCGNGRYLKLMESVGWKVTGVEIDAKAAELAQKSYGLSVFVGDIDEAPFQEQSFDVITASHVIEHIPKPVAFIQRLASLLKKEGLLILVTPNGDSLGHKIFRRNWYCLQPPQHLGIFTIKSMEKLMSTSGLQLLKLATSAKPAQKYYIRSLEIRNTNRLINLETSSFKLSPTHRTMMIIFKWLEKFGNPILR